MYFVLSLVCNTENCNLSDDLFVMIINVVKLTETEHHIWDIRGLNDSREVDYCDSFFMVFLSPSGKSFGTLKLAVSTFCVLPIHAVILPFNAI